MALLTYEQFINKYKGKQIDYDGVAGCQCVDLAKYYLNDVFGIKAGAWGDAHSWYDEWTKYTDLLSKNFTRIANTPDFVPQKGDLVVWSGKLSSGGWGHIALATGEGNTTYFYSYDCNWTGNHDAVTKIKHNYNCVYGVLRPKDQSRINPTTDTKPKQTSDTKMVVDVSMWNPTINYAKLAQEADGMIIRVGYRGYGSAGTLVKDNVFDTHIAGAIKNKIPYGFYFLSQAQNAAEGKAEADFVYNIVKSYKPTYPIYFDSEYSDEPNHKGRADGISKTARTSAAIAFCNRLIALGCKAGVYASESWFADKLDFNQIKSYSIWCAKYGTNNGRAQSRPTLSVYDGWQFTSVYSLSASPNGIDMSYFYKDFGGSTTPTTPTVTYKTYYANDKTGVNYRATPNGTLKGTYKYAAAIKIVVGSETKAGNYTWVKTDTGYWVAKSLLSVTKPSTKTSPFKSNKDYTLTVDIKVRFGAGTNYKQKTYAQLTANAKSHAYNQTYAVLKKGTVVTVMSVVKVSDKEYWGKIPSGWIALMYNGEKYVK